MSTLELTKTAMTMGVWRGILTGSGDKAPEISVTFLNEPVSDVTVTAQDAGKSWVLDVPIPPVAIADGVQTLLITDTVRNEKIGHITLLAGEMLADDIHAEIDLLRAELDMLKRAFRRHCLETT